MKPHAAMTAGMLVVTLVTSGCKKEQRHQTRFDRSCRALLSRRCRALL